jgi:hypothetical protein
VQVFSLTGRHPHDEDFTLSPLAVRLAPPYTGAPWNRRVGDMATLTEVVAAVVLHSSAAAFSHFGVTLDAPHTAPPPEQRVVARSPRRGEAAERVQKAAVCPDTVATGRLIRA